MPTLPLPPASKCRLLVVDDDLATQMMLSEVLIGEGYEVFLAPRVQDVRACFEGPRPDVILLDWRLPDGDGMELLKEITSLWPATRVVMMSGYGSSDVAAMAAQRGAFEFLGKPFHVAQLIQTVRRACTAQPAPGANAAPAPTPSTLPEFVSPAMRGLLRMTRQVATLEVPILILGESGSGKRTLAKLIHACSPHADGPLITVDCAGLTSDTFDRQLFGVAGSPTEPGLLRQAKGGTLLLDGLQSLPPAAQARLASLLESGQLPPVAGDRSELIGTRLLATLQASKPGAPGSPTILDELRERLGTITLRVPPLRDCKEDVLPLALTLLKRFAAQAGKSISGFTPAAEAALQRHTWPGNVRELEEEIQRAVAGCQREKLDIPDLSAALPTAAGS